MNLEVWPMPEDLMEFEIVPVQTSAEAAEKIAPQL